MLVAHDRRIAVGDGYYSDFASVCGRTQRHWNAPRGCSHLCTTSRLLDVRVHRFSSLLFCLDCFSFWATLVNRKKISPYTAWGPIRG